MSEKVVKDKSTGKIKKYNAKSQQWTTLSESFEQDFYVFQDDLELRLEDDTFDAPFGDDTSCRGGGEYWECDGNGTLKVSWIAKKENPYPEIPDTLRHTYTLEGKSIDKVTIEFEITPKEVSTYWYDFTGEGMHLAVVHWEAKVVG